MNTEALPKETGPLPWRALALLLVLSAAVQLAATANVKPLPEYDEAIYWDVSRNCWEHGRFLRSIERGIYFFDHPPLYLYAASLSHLVTDDIAGIRFVSTLFSLGSTVLAALLAARLFGAAAFLPAATLLAFNPCWIFYANSAYQDVPFMLPILAAFVAAFRRRPILAGLLTGAAMLVKYFALGFAAMLALHFLRQPEGGRKAARDYLLVFAAVSILWPIVGLAASSSDFLAKLGYWETQLTMPPMAHHSKVDRVEYLQTMLDRVTPIHALVLVAGTMAAAWRCRALEAQTLMLTAGGYFAVLIGPFFMRSDRYLVEALPFLAILAAVPFSTMRRGNRAIALAVVALLGLSVPLPGTSRLPQLARPQFSPAVLDFVRSTFEAGRFVAEELRPGELLVVNWNGPRFGYLARCNYRFLFTSRDLQEVERAVQGARIVVRDYEAGRWHLPWLPPQDVSKWDAFMEREFQGRDFGPVRVYIRRPEPAG